MSKNKIILVDDEEDVLDLLEIIIESRFDYPVVKLESVESAISYLKQYSDVALIISDYALLGGCLGSVLFKYNSENANYPFIFFSGGFVEDADLVNFDKVNKYNRILSKPLDQDSFLGHLAYVLNGDGSKREEIEESEYRRVKVQSLFNHFDSNVDIFIKLSDKKFVKLLNKNEFSSKEDLMKYLDRGLEYIYLKEDDFKRFTSEVSSKIENDLLKSGSIEEVSEPLSKAIEFVNQTVSQLGISAAQVKLVNTCVKTSLDQIKKGGAQFLDIDVFTKNKGHLISHSLLAMHFSYLMAKEMQINTEGIVNKLSYASILHDITLSPSTLSEIFDLNSEKAKNLTREQRDAIKLHPMQASQTFSKMSDLPADVATIVMEHHELPDGSGFPRSLSATMISPLGALFGLALKFADFVYFNKLTNESLGRLKEELSLNYNKGNYKKPLNSLLNYLDELKL